MAATAIALTTKASTSIRTNGCVSGARVGTPPLASIASAISRARLIALARAPKTTSTDSSPSSLNDRGLGRPASPASRPQYPRLFEKQR